MEIAIAARTLLDHKGRDLWTTAPDATVYDAIDIMTSRNIGALPVLEDERLGGIISERDYMCKVMLKGKSSRDTAVREIMTREVVTVGPDRSVSECMRIVTEHRIRHLPVVDGEELVGIVSIGDLVKWIIATQRMTIEQLERYIVGGYSG